MKNTESSRSLKSILLLPFYALQVFTGSKDFRNPVIGSEWLNRKGLHVWRVKATARIVECVAGG